MAVTQAPYGSWASPITSDLIVAGALRLGQLAVDQGSIYWTEGRASEGGRNALIRRDPEGNTEEITPVDFNVRTRVHEYGGGAYLIAAGSAYGVNFKDQRLYRLQPGQEPQPLTPESESQLRYADGVWDPSRRQLIWVREDHRLDPHQPVNTLVSLDLDRFDQGQPQEGQILISGQDFYASPRLSPDGSHLAWISWDHPNMPWDGTQLWVARITAAGSLEDLRRIAGGEQESIFQPEWSPDGSLMFVSDRSGWWNLYRWSGLDDSIAALYPKQAEFGSPQWVFGMSTYGILAPDRILCSYDENGITQLIDLNPITGSARSIETPFTRIGGLRVAHPESGGSGSGWVVFGAGSPTAPGALVRFDLESGATEILQRSTDLEVEPGYISRPEPIEFPTERGLTAFGFYYPPQNQDFRAPEAERPPLLVKSHGGPTGSTSATFNLRIQYWTSRGFGVLDVNYGGSTGYGREYRQRLQGQWGIVDVEDCINGALYLVNQDRADPERLAIDGGSAGGYTTLAALTFKDVFKAGASLYGVSDLEALARDTHKFESRYLDGLIGPYPERQDLYMQRSPIHAIEHLSCPVIFFQGLEDKIVPPNQAERMVEVLRSKGLPVAYVPFAGEQHGFRRAENIKRALDGEFYFFARVFGFEPAETLEPIPIDNLPIDTL